MVRNCHIQAGATFYALRNTHIVCAPKTWGTWKRWRKWNHLYKRNVDKFQHKNTKSFLHYVQSYTYKYPKCILGRSRSYLVSSKPHCWLSYLSKAISSRLEHLIRIVVRKRVRSGCGLWMHEEVSYLLFSTFVDQEWPFRSVMVLRC